MNANLPESRKSFSAAKRFGKLSFLLIATVFCTGFVLHAIEKSGYKTSRVVVKSRVPNAAMIAKDQAALSAKNSHKASFNVLPTLSYGSSNFTFTKNIAVSLTPASSNVGAPAPGVYNNPVVLGSGVTFSQNGVALDAAGNMYVCDMVGGTGVVKKISADGTSTTIIGSGFVTQSSNVAVDQAGNVYVVDQSQVWKIPAGSTPGTYDAPVIFNHTFSRPFGVAVDATGNVYVTDLSAGGVYKMDNNGANKTRIDTGINSGSGITTDAAGNVYVVDLTALALYEIPASGPQVTLATGFGFPRGVAVDGAGNIYVDDENANAIYKVPPGGGVPIAEISNISNAVGVAVDASYNLYVALLGSAGVNKFSPAGGYFISPSKLPTGLSFDNTTGAITGIPTDITAKSYYIISAFNSAGGVADTIRLRVSPPATTISYTSPNVDTVGVRIDPIIPSSTGVDAPGYLAKEVLAYGFSAPQGLVTDAAGNIYVADQGNNVVKKIPAGGGTPVSFATGFNNPSGMAIDAGGYIYVADKDNADVKKISPDGNTITSIGSGFNTPVGVAVDGAGNVYVADSGNESVYKILVSDGSTVTLSGTFDYLTGIAVDKTGQNIYVSDGSAQSVYKVSPGCGCPEDLGFAFNYPTGVALDPKGNLYVSDVDMVNHTGLVYKGDGQGCNFTDIGATFQNPTGVAVGSSGNIFVDDASANILYQLAPSGGYFLSTELPKGLKFNDTTGTIKGKPAAVTPAANYTVFAYNAGGGTPATVNIEVVLPPAPMLSYSTPNTYTAGTAITPLKPTSQHVVGTAAYGDAPVVIASALGTVKGTAVDKAGNVFVADSLNNAVIMIPKGGGSPVPWGSGFKEPTGVAVDSLGFVYVADFGNGLLKKIAPDGTTITDIGSGSGITSPNSVAVDTAGNVYATDLSTGMVYKIKASDGSSTIVNSSFPFQFPTGIAVDGKNIYVSDGYIGGVAKLGSNGGIPQLMGPFNYPAGVAVDAVGNLYVSDEGDSTIYRIPAHGTNITALSTTGISGPEGLSVDGKGNLYVADVNKGEVDQVVPVGGYYINKALPEGLSFNGKNGSIQGTPTASSVAKDYVVTGYNTAGAVSALFSIAVNLPPPPTISYNSPLVYVVNQTIVPYAPTVANIGTSGFGGEISNAGSGYVFPYGVGVNHTGDVYVTDALDAKLYKIPVNGNPQEVVSTDFVSPLGVAFDTDDNIYVADAGTGTGDGVIMKIPKAGGSPTQVGPTFSSLSAIAVDKDNNIYAADQGSGVNTVYKIDAHGSVSTITSDVTNPSGLAVDAAGNVYITDLLAGAVYKVAKNTTNAVDLGYTFTVPGGVAVDAAGNLYVVDSYTGQVQKIPVGGGSSIPLSGFNFPYGVAIGSNGYLYVTDAGDGALKQVKPSGGIYINPVLPTGLNFNNTTGIISGKPTVVSPAADYTVTAYSLGGTATATVNIAVITHAADLSGLTVSTGTLSPGFNKAKTAYNVSLRNTVNSISVKPKSFDALATIQIRINGDPYVDITSGTASADMALNEGDNPIDVKVTSHDGLTVKVYTVTVKRAAAQGNATLFSMTLNPNTPLKVVSGTDYKNYTTTVQNNVSSITVTPVKQDDAATITVNNVAVASGTASGAINLNEGDNIITTTVTEGTISHTYTTVVTRLPLASLLSLSVSPQTTLKEVAGSDYKDYTATVNNSVSSVTITPLAPEMVSVITVNNVQVTSGTASGPISLNEGANIITTVVTNGAISHTYSITITRRPPAQLFSLVFNPAITLHAITGTDYKNYAGTVDNSVSSVTVTPQSADPSNTILVNNVVVASGTASGAISLNEGDNTITTIVTEGATSHTYNTVITRLPIASLISLSLSPQTALKEVSGSNFKDYTASVVNSVSSVTVTPVASEMTSVITVNNVQVTSGTASGAINLDEGLNTITTVVTNGAISHTYSIKITRQPAAQLFSLTFNPGITVHTISGPDYRNYAGTVDNSVTSVTATPKVLDPAATVTVNNVAVASGTASGAIGLNEGDNIITAVVTQGSASNTYTFVITRTPSSLMMAYDPSKDAPITSSDIVVHQNVSPNGDGKSDGLVIEGIAAHPDNKLQIMSRSGALVYEARGYDNATKLFDGHANNGKLQQAGTYFYSLEYKDGKEIKRKTGFIVLKY